MASQVPDGSANACLPNINLAERRRRLAFGMGMLALGLVALALLLLGDAGRWWRLPLIVVFYPAAVGYFQWADHTCVALAARDQRKMGERAEPIEDAGELTRVKRQARAVQWKSLAVAGVLLALALVV